MFHLSMISPYLAQLYQDTNNYSTKQDASRVPIWPQAGLAAATVLLLTLRTVDTTKIAGKLEEDSMIGGAQTVIGWSYSES
jgi:hypothetical protein